MVGERGPVSPTFHRSTSCLHTGIPPPSPLEGSGPWPHSLDGAREAERGQRCRESPGRAQGRSDILALRPIDRLRRGHWLSWDASLLRVAPQSSLTARPPVKPGGGAEVGRNGREEADPPTFLPLVPDRGALREGGRRLGAGAGWCLGVPWAAAPGLRLSGACLPEVSAWRLDVQVGVPPWEMRTACAHVNERQEQETEPQREPREKRVRKGGGGMVRGGGEGRGATTRRRHPSLLRPVPPLLLSKGESVSPHPHPSAARGGSTGVGLGTAVLFRKLDAERSPGKEATGSRSRARQPRGPGPVAGRGTEAGPGARGQGGTVLSGCVIRAQRPFPPGRGTGA